MPIMPIFSRKPPSISNHQDTFEDGTETAPLAQDTDAMQRFTATGRPKPSYNPSALGNLPSAFTHQAPQFLPQQFTDDSVLLIPIPISALRVATRSPPPTPSASENPAEETKQQPPQQQRRSSSSSSRLMNRWRGGKKTKEEFKMVEMTRGEYLRYWAKDEEGRYIGTEPEGEGARRLRERGEV